MLFFALHHNCEQLFLSDEHNAQNNFHEMYNARVHEKIPINVQVLNSDLYIHIIVIMYAFKCDSFYGLFIYKYI